jgi:two-component system nitrate/nitrite response regulator NarL
VLLLAEDPRRPSNGGVGAGVHAGTTRGVSARELAAAIRAIAEGRDHHAELLLRGLSERERQIVALLVRGDSNRRIAESCQLSVNTVRTHIQNVLVKLGVHSKLEAAALAVRQGLVSVEDHSA